MARTGIGAASPMTLIDAFAETVKKNGTKPALAYKPPGTTFDNDAVDQSILQL